ncbi:hypothetical protein BV25DRAFT_683804 [Artomyces pyxidatus]|uniref:Uncharacterized protein n=1 Tax=Artomyces pyxidatus TaxID=48021 RepID=A0ACB8T311_9AGAM|nr:hypothetical protein BV25DRAFT_683804 [Artomyces pyxidatus]
MSGCKLSYRSPRSPILTSADASSSPCSCTTPRTFPSSMCHRQLRFLSSTLCGHLIFSGETNIDCNDSHCHISRAHPADCGEPPRFQAPCTCRRYYTQPERLVTGQVGTTPPVPVSRLTHSPQSDQKCAICQ